VISEFVKKANEFRM